MADDDITIDVDDLDTIQVEVEEPQPKPKADPKTKVARVRLDPDPQTSVDNQEALRKAQEAVRAAEATAASERARADAAERARLAAQQQAEQTAQRAQLSEVALIDSSIASAQAELEAQREAYVRAAEAGEFGKMGEIQVKIARAASALDRLEGQKSTIEVRSAEGSVREPLATSAEDKFLGQFTPAAQSWLRQHRDCWPPEYGGDRTKHNKMLAGHYDAQAQNIPLNSPEYFELIESHLGSAGGTYTTASAKVDPTHARQHTSRAAEVSQADTSRRQAVPAAPVSRDAVDAGGNSQGSRRSVTLTRAQQEAAEFTFPHLSKSQAHGQYALGLIEAMAEGKIGRTTH